MDEHDFQELLRYQNTLARQVVSEAKTDRKIKFLEILNRMSHQNRRKVQTEALLHTAEEYGFSESEAYRVLEELERDGVVIEAGIGHVKRS